MRLNKICGLEDFADPELAGAIRDVSAYKLACLPELPRSAEHRKDWEVAMAVLALRRCGALRPDATILGVAAGTEDTLFYLTNHVRQVFATDRYVGPGAWGPVAPASMIVEPTAAAPCAFDLNRLVVQHMDARSLRYPDDTFDGVFSSGSIEHVGELLDVANAAFEMGRVLKPGGVLTLSTELQISGPPRRHRLAPRHPDLLPGRPPALHRGGYRPRAGRRPQHRRLRRHPRHQAEPERGHRGPPEPGGPPGPAG